MVQNDKLLTGVIAGIIVIVVAAFVIALRQPPPDYTSGSAPDDVAHNYLLALQRGDYERAYAYLSPTVPGYPATLAQFVDEASGLVSPYGSNAATTETMQSTTVTGDRAVVDVRQTTFQEGGLFESRQYDNDYRIRLERSSSSEWRISHSDVFWDDCWDRPNDCRDRGMMVPAKPLKAYP